MLILYRTYGGNGLKINVLLFCWWSTQDGLLQCGGGGSPQSCYLFKDGNWTLSHSLREKRVRHSSWQTEEGRVVLLGGWFSNNTTETVQYSTVQYSNTTTETVQYNTVQYSNTTTETVLTRSSGDFAQEIFLEYETW